MLQWRLCAFVMAACVGAEQSGAPMPIYTSSPSVSSFTMQVDAVAFGLSSVSSADCSEAIKTFVVHVAMDSVPGSKHVTKRATLSALSATNEIIHSQVLGDYPLEWPPPQTSSDEDVSVHAEHGSRLEADDLLSDHNGAPLQGGRANTISEVAAAGTVSAPAVVARDVFVDYGGDAAASPADCASNIDGADASKFSGNCTLRSAVEYCLGLDLGASAVCAIHLPSSGDVEVDPVIGSIVIIAQETTPSLVLYGDNSRIIQAKSQQGCQLFYIDGLSNTIPSGYFVEINDVTISSFGDKSASGGSIFAKGPLSIDFNSVYFRSNEGSYGGAVYVQYNVNVSCFGCVFERNSCASSGSALYSYGGALIVTNTTFIDNTAEGGSYGTLYLRDVPGAHIEDCIFDSNTASSGGAIFIGAGSDRVMVLSCTFTDNYATAIGGVVFVDNSNFLTIVDCDFAFNSARSTGGAIYASFSAWVTILDCSFVANRGLYSAGTIGLWYSEDALISSSLFTSSLSDYGGVIFIDDSSHFSTITDCSFSTSYALWHGGAILVDNSEVITIEGCSFDSNVATRNGGAVQVSFCEDFEIINCVMTDNEGLLGGGINVHSCEAAKLINNQYYGNQAMNDGGAMYLFYSDASLIESSIFDSNFAENGGGAMYLFYSSEVDVSGCEFTLNAADFGGSVQLFYSDFVTVTTCNFSFSVAGFSGGGVYTYFSESISMEGSIFSSNVAASGGAISATDIEGLSLRNCFFKSNTAETGGALFSASSMGIFCEGTNFSANVASVASGGAIHFSQGGDFTVTRVVFLENVAKLTGGSLSLNDVDSVIIGHSKFIDNAAATDGGAVQVMSSTNIEIGNSTFTRNSVTEGYGSAIWASATDLDLNIGNEFVSNAAHQGAGTVFWEYSSGMVEPRGHEQCVFENNTAAYGEIIATESVRLIMPTSSGIVLSNYETNLLELSVYLEDYYHQVVRTDNSTFVTISTDPVNCNDKTTAYVSGILQQPCARGVNNFREVQAFCAPEYNITVAATCSIQTSAGSIETTAQTTVYFRPCETGEIYDEDICIKCANSYTFTAGGSQCEECPDHASSCEGSTIWVDTGYWRKSVKSATLLSCPMGGDSCVGGAYAGDELCEQGYESALCAVCSSGYAYRSALNTCEDCANSAFNPVALVGPVVIVGILIALALFMYRYFKDGKDYETTICQFLINLRCLQLVPGGALKSQFESFKIQLTARVKVYVTLYQILLAAPFVLDLTFPKSYTTVMAAFSIIGLNFAEDSGMTCLWRMDYVDELMVQTLLPFCIAAAVGISYVFHMHIHRCNTSTAHSHASDRWAYLKSLYSQVFLTLTYLLVPTTVTSIFRMFPCQNVDPDEDSEGADWYMRADYSIKCSSDRYFFGVSWAVGMLIVYAVGIPMWYWFLLYSSKHDIASRLNVEDKVELKKLDLRLAPIRFLFASYKPEFWYWELIETFQRISFAGLLVVINPGSMLQIIIGLLLALFFITLYSTYAPYMHSAISTVKNLTQWQIYAVYFIALLIRTDKLNSSSYRSAIQGFLILAVFANFIYDAVLFAFTRFGANVILAVDDKSASDIEVNKAVVSPLADENGAEQGTRMSTTEMVGR